jgi:hypothetical protein
MPGEHLVWAAGGRLYLRADDDFASEIAIGSVMYMARRENSEQVKSRLMAYDFALVEGLDNLGAPSVALVLANHCSFEIAGWPEAGIASAAQSLAYQFQCLTGISMVVMFHTVSLADLVAVLSDAVAQVFGADRVKVEGAPMGVHCSAWDKAVVGFGEIAGLAFAVFDSPLRHSVRPHSCWRSCLGSLPPMIDVLAETAVP